MCNIHVHVDLHVNPFYISLSNQVTHQTPNTLISTRKPLSVIDITDDPFRNFSDLRSLQFGHTLSCLFYKLLNETTKVKNMPKPQEYFLSLSIFLLISV